MMQKHPRAALTVSALGLILFLPLLIGVATSAAWIKVLDQTVVHAVTASRPAGLTDFLVVITNLGSATGVILIGLVIAAWLFYTRKKRYALFLAIGVLGMTIINSIIKYIIRRPRPFIVDPSITPLVKIGGFSFPSGHASSSLALYGCLILICWATLQPRALKVWLTIFSVLMIALTGYSRIYVQVHFPTDVLAGYALALIWISFLWWLMAPWLTKVWPTGWHLRR